ncbi:hypothetical protein L3X38_001696 [Prunus dulcis]|uniref:Uncharacterized protein n=1 Tax=Prunus dulcis TaxID=3755 RepID=A0AAD4WSL6_PRUDU|nr:hypothetical protein L3X38_001696 [Prunus dulcis]
MDEKHFIKMAQNVLRLLLRKKFDDIEFMDLQDVAQRASNYELLLREEIQRKNNSNFSNSQQFSSAGPLSFFPREVQGSAFEIRS